MRVMDAYGQALRKQPIDTTWIDKRTDPQAYGATLVELKDVMDVYTWMCSPGKFTWRYPTTEIIVILRGHAILKPADRRGESFEIRDGSAVMFQKGDVVEWEILQPIQKIAVFPATLSKYLEPANSLLTKMREWKRRVVAQVRSPSFRRAPRAAPLAADRLQGGGAHNGQPSRS
jgi:uncharacterized cupin superfamily protein